MVSSSIIKGVREGQLLPGALGEVAQNSLTTIFYD